VLRPSRPALAMRADRLHLLTVLALAGAVLAMAPTCAKPPPWRAGLERVGIRFVSATELKAMMEHGDDFVLVDARDEVHYDRGHIRGAISIPADDKPLRDVDVRRAVASKAGSGFPKAHPSLEFAGSLCGIIAP
jgi:hypothetical protein